MGSEKKGCKVCRVIEDRELTKMDERLVAHWKGDSVQRKGYRKLAKWLNVIILRRAMDRAGVPTLGGEAEAKYERLQGDDGTTASEVEGILSNEGIDVEGVRDDFVSYGVVRTHIKGCLDAEREHTENDWETRSLEITKDHSETKASNAVKSLIKKGKIQTAGEVDVDVSIRIECEECQTRIPLGRALKRGRVCNCVANESGTV